jgi:hypothetical protein
MPSVALLPSGQFSIAKVAAASVALAGLGMTLTGIQLGAPREVILASVLQTLLASALAVITK